MTKRASYREGVEWIALNDDPGSSLDLDDPSLSGDQERRDFDSAAACRAFLEAWGEVA